MTSTRRFSRPVLSAIRDTKILGIRAGIEARRFIGIWAIVVDGRVFVRSWNDKMQGWHRVFVEESRGAIQIADREIRVRARKTRGKHLMDAIDRAYAEKYNTPGSRRYVRGLASSRRKRTTTELVPR